MESPSRPEDSRRSFCVKLLHLLTAALLAAPSLQAGAEPKLEHIAVFPTQQVTGIGVSPKSGRIFVNFPDWADPHTLSVAELAPDGRLKPYPDEAWNSKDGDPAKRWVCVQSVVVDDEDHLWVLDPASPKMAGVTPGGAKLVKIDLRTNKVAQVIPFPADIASPKSYLNDVRIDSKNQTAYITESGEGSIIVVDLRSGGARRLLKQVPATLAEDSEIVVDGIKPIDAQTGKSPAIHADGIAFDAAKDVVYFHALTGHTLYSISAADLRNDALSSKDLEARISAVTKTPKPDGMLETPDSKILLTAIEDNGIVEIDPATGHIRSIIQDKLLQWPDTLAWGPNGKLYITTSQIHRMPRNNNGVNKQQGPFGIFAVQVPAEKKAE